MNPRIDSSPLLPALTVLLILLPQLAFASANAVDCLKFSRNLRVGISGNDVQALQLILNRDPATRISESGVGSPGNETEYFGMKTRLAVIKFQELYATEILAPVSLIKGTGMVGAGTRAKLSLLCSGTSSLKNDPFISTNTSISPAPSLKDSAVSAYPSQIYHYPPNNVPPYIMWPSSYAVPEGGKFTIKGGGFAPDGNIVVIGDLKISATPVSLNTLEATIPKDAKKGKFALTIINTKGTSNKSFIVITAPGALAPKITSVTPTSGLLGTLVTVTGENFSSDWNEVRAGGQSITGTVSADGKSLTFTASLPIPGVSSGTDVPNVDVKFPLWFYIVNPNGVSGTSIFTIKV